MEHMYDELLPWYRLLDPLEEHEDEADLYADALSHAASGPVETLLELGAGAGHNAFYLKRRFSCTLSDLSEGMLELSRELNPDCEHVAGDMRDVRLGTTFDAVLIHDAICYMATVDDLRAAMATAFEHLRPGGAVILAPDFLTETFEEGSESYEGADDTRKMIITEFYWQPDEDAQTYRVDYTYMLREDSDVRSVHDVHIEGLFDKATWLALMQEVGFEDVHTVERTREEDWTDEVFVARRPELATA